MNPLKAWRDELQMTQAQFAAHLTELRGAPVTQAQVCVWENWGPVSGSTLAQLELISEGRVDAKRWHRRLSRKRKAG